MMPDADFDGIFAYFKRKLQASGGGCDAGFAKPEIAGAVSLTTALPPIFPGKGFDL